MSSSQNTPQRQMEEALANERWAAARALMSQIGPDALRDAAAFMARRASDSRMARFSEDPERDKEQAQLLGALANAANASKSVAHEYWAATKKDGWIQPTPQEAQMAIWAAESGGARAPVDAHRFFGAKWEALADETIVAVARVFTAAGFSPMAPAEPGPEQESGQERDQEPKRDQNQFHSSGAWCAIVCRMAETDRFEALKTLIQDAKKEGFESSIAHARGQVASLARNMRANRDGAIKKALNESVISQETAQRAFAATTDSWKERIEKTQAAGLELGSAGLREVAHWWRNRFLGAKNDAELLDVERLAIQELGWCAQALSLPRQEIGVFVDEEICHNFASQMRSGGRFVNDARLVSAFLKWGAEQGVAPSSASWIEAAEKNLARCSKMMSIWPEEKPPVAVFGLLAKNTSASWAADVFETLLRSRPWSAQERGLALAEVAAVGADCASKLDMLVEGSEKLDPSFLEGALLTLCSRPKTAPGVSSDKELSQLACSWIDEMGANPKGAAGSGVLLRAALRTERWKTAQELDKRGAMGAATVAWLLAPRKNDSEYLEPWKQKARAHKESSELTRELARDAAARKKEAKEAGARASEAKSEQEAQEPATPAQKPTRRL